MDEAFAESTVHATPPWWIRTRNVATSLWDVSPGYSAHVVLGRRLRPLSFWHRFGLDAVRSPFAGHPGPFDLAALDIAARVCQAARPHILRTPHRGVATVRACLLQYRYGRADRLARELAKFTEYRQEFEQAPIYAETPDSRRAKTPWYQVVVFQLLQFDPRLRQLALTDPVRAENEAWMMPVGQGLWRLASLAEARGEDVNIMSEADRKAFRSGGHKV